MKKLLTAALALTVGVTCAIGLAACDNGSENTNTMTDAEIAQSAINSLKSAYASAERVETPSDYDVLGKVKVSNTLYDVDWEVSASNNDISDYIKVGDMDEDTYIVTISITKKPPVAIDYTLTASVTVGDATKSYGFEKRLPASAIGGDVQTKSVGIQFDDSAKRTQFTNDIQVWEQSGITVTNNKYNSINNVGNYSDPARFYQGSKVKIEYPGMKHLVIDSVNFDNNPYADNLKKSLEAINLPAEITVDENGDVTVKLDYAMDYIEFVATAQTRMYSIDIEAIVGGATDADKVAAAKAMVSLEKTVYSAKGEYDLPASSYGASVTWSVKGTSDLVKVEGGKLVVENIPTSETTVTLVAAIKSGNENDSAEVEIKLVPALNLEHKGTADDPFTVAEVMAIASTLDADAFYQVDGKTAEICVEGYVIKVGTWAQTETYANWTGSYIATSASSKTDSADALQIYRLNLDSTYLKSSSDLKVGAKIVVSGALQNYKGNTPEITNSGSINVKAVAYDASGATDVTPPDTDVELTHAGTAEDPFTVAEAIKIASSLTSGAYYQVDGENAHVYVKGYVTNSPEARNDGKGIFRIYISDTKGDTSNKFQIYYTVWNEVVPEGSTLKAGDEVVACAFITNYNNGTYELTGTAADPAVITVWNKAGDNPGGEVDSKYGTEAAPLSVAQALALAAEECVNNYDVTAQVVYMKGVVTDAGTFGGTYYSNMYFADAGNLGTTILAYTINLNKGVAAPVVGDTLVICGYIKNYDGKIEFASNNGIFVYILSNDEAGERAPEVEVEGDLLYTLDASGHHGSNNGYANNCDVTVDGITWNIEGNSTMDPWRFGGKEITGVDRKLTSKTALSGTVTKLVINFGAKTITVNSVTLKVYSSDPTQDGATVVSTITVEYAANSKVIIEAPEGVDWSNCYYQIIFNVTNTGTSNQYVSINTIEFYGDED